MFSKNKRLLVCFSGGKTSAYMTKLLIDAGYYVTVVFANTGQECNETLDFVRDCDVNFGFNTVWVEANVHHKANTGTTHKIVTYQSASRQGEPFEEVIKKYGIPNHSYLHCTRELKERPIHDYVKSIGWKRKGYATAIGIRTDELRRVKRKEDYQSIIYPLVDIFPSDKVDVNDFWEQQRFNLQLEEHEGNCKWCWKKSLKKHLRLISEAPEKYDFPLAMEAKYPYSGHNDGIRKRVFFRGNRSALDLFSLAKEIVCDDNLKQLDFSYDSGCSESCEVFEMTEG